LLCRCERALVHDFEPLGEDEERARERRALRPVRHALPVHLLAHGPRDLEDRAEVGLLLVDGEEFRDEDVVDGRDERAVGADLELGGSREVLVADRAVRGMEDEFDEIVPVPCLVEPVLRGALGTEPFLRQHFEGAVGVLLAEEEVDVVVGRWPSARPDRETAAEHVVDVALAQRRARTLHRREQRMEILGCGRGHAGTQVPGSGVRRTWRAGIRHR
jgi:hypothetical protein